MHDDPQTAVVDVTLRHAPPEAFKILLAHRPGAWDTAAPRGIPLTLAGHIHGGLSDLPIGGGSAGRLITKYVVGILLRGNSPLYTTPVIGCSVPPLRPLTPHSAALSS